MAADPLAQAVVQDGSAPSLAVPDDGSPAAPFLVDSASGKVDGWSAPLAPLGDSARRDCWVPVATAAADNSVPKTVADRLAKVAESGVLVRPASVRYDLELVDLWFEDSAVPDRLAVTAERPVVPMDAPDDTPELETVRLCSPESMVGAVADNSAHSMAAARTVPAAELAEYGCRVPSHLPVLLADSLLSLERLVWQEEPASQPELLAGLWYVLWPILAEPAVHRDVARESADAQRMGALPAVAST